MDNPYTNTPIGDDAQQIDQFFGGKDDLPSKNPYASPPKGDQTVPIESVINGDGGDKKPTFEQLSEKMGVAHYLRKIPYVGDPITNALHSFKAATTTAENYMPATRFVGSLDIPMYPGSDTTFKDQTQRENQAAWTNHPIAAGIGAIAGTVASIPTRTLGPNGAPMMTLATKLPYAAPATAGQTAAMSTINGALGGASEEEGLDRARGALTGGASGLALAGSQGIANKASGALGHAKWPLLGGAYYYGQEYIPREFLPYLGAFAFGSKMGSAPGIAAPVGALTERLTDDSK